MPKSKRRIGGERPIASTFQIVEAYKSIRTNLLFALAPCESRIVTVSSAEPGAGKSTVSSNLAITMAQTGARVLLVDADMRRPSQHRTFRVEKHNGLSRVLGGLSSLDDCLCREVAHGMDLLPSGSLPPNPSELLGSEAMGTLLAELSARYDYVFVDTPALGVVSDALLLCEQTAGLLLAARQRQTTYEELSAAVEAVRSVSGNLLGVVITDMKETAANYGRYDKYRYYKAHDYSYTADNPAD